MRLPQVLLCAFLSTHVYSLPLLETQQGLIARADYVPPAIQNSLPGVNNDPSNISPAPKAPPKPKTVADEVAKDKKTNGKRDSQAVVEFAGVAARAPPGKNDDGYEADDENERKTGLGRTKLTEEQQVKAPQKKPNKPNTAPGKDDGKKGRREAASSEMLAARSPAHDGTTPAGKDKAAPGPADHQYEADDENPKKTSNGGKKQVPGKEAPADHEYEADDENAKKTSNGGKQQTPVKGGPPKNGEGKSKRGFTAGDMIAARSPGKPKRPAPDDGDDDQEAKKQKVTGSQEKGTYKPPTVESDGETDDEGAKKKTGRGVSASDIVIARSPEGKRPATEDADEGKDGKKQKVTGKPPVDSSGYEADDEAPKKKKPSPN